MIIALAGDTMLGRLVNEHILTYGPEYPLYGVESFFKKSDFSLVNLECTIAQSGKPFPSRAFYFRADPVAVNVLKRADISCVSLANNHMMDFREEALIETLKHLDKAKIAHAGAGENISKAQKPGIISVNGIKIGVLSCADHFEEYAATETKPGINYIEVKTKGKHFDRIKKLISKIRKLVDILIFSIHWGPNMRQRPTKDFIDFAHAVMDLGVDIYHGHSAHIFQSIEIYEGRPIFYDTGELVDDYYVGPGETNDRQLMFLIKLTGKKVSGIELIPLHISMCQANPAKNELYEIIYSRIKDLSAEFNTNIIRKNNKVVVEL